MKVKDLIEKLQELDPEEEITFYDREWGPDGEIELRKETIYRYGEAIEVWTITN